MANPLKKTPTPPKKRLIRKISRGHQITLPPCFLKENDLHIGDTVEILEQEGKVIIQPLISETSIEKRQLISKIKALFERIDSDLAESSSPTNEEQLLEEINREIESTRKSS